MTKLMRVILAISTLLPFQGHSEPTQSMYIAVSAGVVSVGSSALVSGLILSPVLLPSALVIHLVSPDKKTKRVTLDTQTADGKQVKIQLPEKVAEKEKLKSGDKLTLEKAPKTTGALLKKDGKVISHMLYENDAGLSQNQTLKNTK